MRKLGKLFWLGIVLATGMFWGVAATVIDLMLLFKRVASLAPEHKAEFLSQGIDRAMNYTLAGMLVTAAGGVLMIVGVARSRRT